METYIYIGIFISLLANIVAAIKDWPTIKARSNASNKRNRALKINLILLIFLSVIGALTSIFGTISLRNEEQVKAKELNKKEKENKELAKRLLDISQVTLDSTLSTISLGRRLNDTQDSLILSQSKIINLS